MIFSRSNFIFQFQFYSSNFQKGSGKENHQFLSLGFLNKHKANNLSFQISRTDFSYFLKGLSFQRFQNVFQWKRMCPCVTMVYHSIPHHIFLQFQRSIFCSIFFHFRWTPIMLNCLQCISCFFLLSKIPLSKKFATVSFAKSSFKKSSRF